MTLLFMMSLSGNKHTTSYEAATAIEIFNFQYIRADQNLFGLIPACRTAFLSLQKAIDLFAKIAKLTIPMIKKSATKFLCSRFFYLCCCLRGD